jgi:putative transcriptional regulator
MQNRVHELRRARGVSQAELAEAMDVTRQTIISLEKGKYNASLILAHKLSQFFDVDIETLFIFNEEEENYHD